MSVEELKVTRLLQLPVLDLQPLLEESQALGFNFLEWLIRDYNEATNRFDQPGEALFAIYNRSDMIAIGGLNHDPYLPDSATGRVRRVYVLSLWRRKGVGKRLMQEIIAEARRHYKLLTLRTFDEPADKFYRALGFHKETQLDGVSHSMVLA